MKIGIDIRLIGKKRTGDEVYFFNLVKNMAKADRSGLTPTINEYFLYTDRDPEKNADLKREIEELSLGNNFKIVFINSPNRFWWNFWTLPAYLKKNPVDVFHTQYIAPFWLPKKIKLVLTIHDISFNFFPEYIKRSDLFLLKTLIPRSIRRADKILAVSESEKKNIIAFYKIPPEKADFAYNGVDYERFSHKYSEEKLKKISAKYHLPNTGYALYVGTLQPRKNIPVLIEALNTYLNTYLNKHPENDIKLVLAGNRSGRNFDRRINETIKKYGLENKVIFPGWIDEEDKPALLQMAKIFVFPSLYEGFGIPVIEAMAAGTPVVCPDISVFREIGKNAALFCDAKDSQEFSEKINQLISNEGTRSNLVKSGLEVAKKYSWGKTAEKTLDIYEKLGKK